jgi:hypothetical protein
VFVCLFVCLCVNKGVKPVNSAERVL